MRDFLLEKQKSNVPMEGGGPFPGLEKEVLNLTIAGGAAVVVDLEDVVLFWYFPNYIGTGLQVRIDCAASGFVAIVLNISVADSFGQTNGAR